MPSKDIFDEIIELMRKEADSNPLTYVSPEILRDFKTDFPKTGREKQTPTNNHRPDSLRASSAPRSSVAETPHVAASVTNEPVKEMDWDSLKAATANCTKCRLHSSRKNVVFSDGSQNAELMFIGEGPGADEDAQGIPFVGKAGQLLTKMIEAMQFKRPEVYIGNIVKCRPPGNRNPEPEEAAQCLPFLLRQIELVNPKVIVLLGAVPLLYLLGLKGITRLRGVWHEFNGIKVMPTFHPAYLLRNPPSKKQAWEDLQKVMAEFGKTPAPKR